MSVLLACEEEALGSREYWSCKQEDTVSLLLLLSKRLRDVAALGATSEMSPDTPKTALRLSVSKAESEVAIARV